jgi:hypothetical protein
VTSGHVRRADKIPFFASFPASRDVGLPFFAPSRPRETVFFDYHAAMKRDVLIVALCVSLSLHAHAQQRLEWRDTFEWRVEILEDWLRGRDLNPRPLGYEPNELPDCSTPRHW